MTLGWSLFVGLAAETLRPNLAPMPLSLVRCLSNLCAARRFFFFFYPWGQLEFLLQDQRCRGIWQTCYDRKELISVSKVGSEINAICRLLYIFTCIYTYTSYLYFHLDQSVIQTNILYPCAEMLQGYLITWGRLYTACFKSALTSLPTWNRGRICREIRESIWILLGGVCVSLWTLLHPVCVKLLTVYESLTGFWQINLARVFVRVDSRTRVEILALLKQKRMVL